jgi:DNA-binding NtrC family response regulator
MAKVLVVDDDAIVLSTVAELLQFEGYKVVRCSDLTTAYRQLEVDPPDLAVIDFHLPDGDAIQFLSAAKNLSPATKSIVLTGHGTIDLAVRAVKEGAEQFLTKPVQPDVLTAAVRASLGRQQDHRKQLASEISRTRYEKNPFEGNSSVIRRLAHEANRVVNVERPVLIQGETGTGKGVLAEWLHKNGPRSDEPRVDVNCAGLSKDLLESELFGYEKGAFTGAAGNKQGLVEVAHRGILFLDEVGEMDITVQPKLLKVLEDNRFRRLGDVRERVVDIQIIAATNRNLLEAVKQMRFREDLYFRVCTFHLRIPPLRERVEDIPLIARVLMRNLARDLARSEQELSPSAEAALKNYSWPGNIRELRNVLERVALTCDSRIIDAGDLGLVNRTVEPEFSALEAGSGVTLAEIERQHIARVLSEEAGKVTQAAVRLGIPRSTLYQKIKVYGISLETN